MSTKCIVYSELQRISATIRHNMRSTIYDSHKSVNDMECEDEENL